MSTNLRSRSLVGSGRPAVRISGRVVAPTVFARWRPRGVPEAADHRSALVPAQDRLDHLSLPRLDKSHDFQLATALRTGQRVDLVHPLDAHGPDLGATAGRRRLQDLAARWPGPQGIRPTPGGSHALARTGLTDLGWLRGVAILIPEVRGAPRWA